MKIEMRGFGTCYKPRGTRFWWVQYFRNGERVRESTREEKPKAAQDYLRNKILELQELRPAAGSGGCTVGDLYEALERDYSINARKSLADLKALWKNHLQPAFAQLPAHLLDSDRVQIYAAARQKQGAANASINRELSALKRMFRLALKAKKVKLVPYIEMLVERNVRKGFVKDAQYEAVARETAAIGLWLRAMFELAYIYGWRKSELLEMRVSQADLMERTLSLNPGETKNDEGRQVEMTGKVFDLVCQCAAGKAPEDFLFTRTEGRSKGKRIFDFRDAWGTATKAAGVEGLLFHDLRRTGLRNMRRGGISEKVAMTIAGQKTRSVFERYNIVDGADMHEAVRKLDHASNRRRQRELFTQETLAFQSSEAKPPMADRVTDSEARTRKAN